MVQIQIHNVTIESETKHSITDLAPLLIHSTLKGLGWFIVESSIALTNFLDITFFELPLYFTHLVVDDAPGSKNYMPFGVSFFSEN